jgi:hypothetical protein
MRKFYIVPMILLFALGIVGSAVAQDSFTDQYFKGKVAVQRLVDAEICMVVWHDGSPQSDGSAVTQAYFSSKTDADIYCYLTGTSVAGLDSNVSTDGIIDVTDGSGDTFGEVADLINAAPGWHCQLVDVLRADATAHVASITAVKDSVCFQNAGVTLGRDTADDQVMSVGLARYGWGNEDLTGWQMFLDAFVIDAVFNDGTNYVEVYDCDDIAKTETAVLRTEAAATTVEFWFPTYGPTGYPILAVAPGHRIVVKSVYSAAANPDALSLMGALGSIVRVH